MACERADRDADERHQRHHDRRTRQRDGEDAGSDQDGGVMGIHPERLGGVGDLHQCRVAGDQQRRARRRGHREAAVAQQPGTVDVRPARKRRAGASAEDQHQHEREDGGRARDLQADQPGTDRRGHQHEGDSHRYLDEEGRPVPVPSLRPRERTDQGYVSRVEKRRHGQHGHGGAPRRREQCRHPEQARSTDDGRREQTPDQRSAGHRCSGRRWCGRRAGRLVLDS